MRPALVSPRVAFCRCPVNLVPPGRSADGISTIRLRKGEGSVGEKHSRERRETTLRAFSRSEMPTIGPARPSLPYGGAILAPRMRWAGARFLGPLCQADRSLLPPIDVEQSLANSHAPSSFTNVSEQRRAATISRLSTVDREVMRQAISLSRGPATRHRGDRALSDEVHGGGVLA
jgi:hypothetical protein